MSRISQTSFVKVHIEGSQ